MRKIAAAEAERDTAIRRAVALREAAVAKATADQERVIAETASLEKQAEAQRDLAERKLTETRSACELLIAQNRRARTTAKANAARGVGSGRKDAVITRLKDSVAQLQASNAASHMLFETDSLEDRNRSA
ncbi:MAG TPA: hypothetical protein VHN81_09365 [Edaphobacter sp.]|nr:hypothetical protein [Edaphobacter sp.]